MEILVQLHFLSNSTEQNDVKCWFSCIAQAVQSEQTQQRSTAELHVQCS